MRWVVYGLRWVAYGWEMAARRVQAWREQRALAESDRLSDAFDERHKDAP